MTGVDAVAKALNKAIAELGRIDPPNTYDKQAIAELSEARDEFMAERITAGEAVRRLRGVVAYLREADRLEQS